MGGARDFLNPDEALHFQVANHVSWASAYRASLTTAHPPLLIFVLHWWRGLGTSEFLLRIPSVIAGTVFCWFLFRWTTLLFGRIPGGRIGVCNVSSRRLIALSAEVRQYALLLAFMAAAMWLLERSFMEAVGRRDAAGLCLYSAGVVDALFGIFICRGPGGIFDFSVDGEEVSGGIETSVGRRTD